MTKYWLLRGKANYLIAIFEDVIYLGSTKKYIESDLIRDLNKGIEPKEIFSIPFSYIKSVTYSEKVDTLIISYGKKSEEEVVIPSTSTRKEVFECLKNELNQFDYIEKTPSIFKFAKPQWFAILILTGIFVWSFYIAIEISKGAEYQIVGNGVGLAGIILLIAQLGTYKVVLSYISLMTIAVFSLVRRNKKRTLTQYLIR